MPKVSVLMPVYNADRYLKEAIDSILCQTFSDWELILINDGSTDNSEDIIQSYTDERIIYIKNESNIGLIHTLNKGIDICKGTYIARMDADDIAMPERLSKQVRFMEQNPQHIMCGTDAIIINKENKQTGKIKNLTQDKYLQINLLFSVPFIHPSMLIRKDILLQNKYDLNYKHVEDYELWCRLATKGKVANIGQFLLKYRWHETNVSVLNSKIQDKQKDKIIREQLAVLDLEPSERELICNKMAFKLYVLGQKQDISVDMLADISDWYDKLIKHNKKKRVYNQNDLIAYLWSRWCVVCLSQKQYLKMLFPQFASFNPIVWTKLVSLLYFLKQK